jgi:hypothetical protein
MIYIKSVIAGLGALMIAALLATLLTSIYVNRGPAEGGAIGLDPISLGKQFAKQSFAWILASVIFLAGFVWEFRRAASK